MTFSSTTPRRTYPASSGIRASIRSILMIRRSSQQKRDINMIMVSNPVEGIKATPWILRSMFTNPETEMKASHPLIPSMATNPGAEMRTSCQVIHCMFISIATRMKSIPDEIPVPNFSRTLHLIELLRESIVAYMATQHAPAITNSESKISEEEFVIVETDKLHVSKDVHKDDLSPQHPTPITISPDIITSIPESDKALPPGDPAPITSPPNFISLIVDDQRVEVVHVPSHHYAGDPYLHDIIWCDGLPYRQMLPSSSTSVMVVNDLSLLFKSYRTVAIVTSLRTSTKD